MIRNNLEVSDEEIHGMVDRFFDRIHDRLLNINSYNQQNRPSAEESKHNLPDGEDTNERGNNYINLMNDEEYNEYESQFTNKERLEKLKEILEKKNATCQVHGKPKKKPRSGFGYSPPLGNSPDASDDDDDDDENRFVDQNGNPLGQS